MNSIYELEKLVSSCSESDSETSSLHEEETTFIVREACSCDPIVVEFGKKTGSQDVCKKEERSCFNNLENGNEEKQRDNPWRNQKASIESPISETRNPLEDQPCTPSEGLREMFTKSPDNTHDGLNPLLTDLKMENPEESLQSSSTDNVSEIQVETSPKVRNDKKFEKTVALNSKLQNFGRKDMKEIQKNIQKWHQKFNRPS